MGQTPSDSVALGCIPVFFSDLSDDFAHWFWGEWKDRARVLVPRGPFAGTEDCIDLVQLLQSAPPQLISLMQETLQLSLFGFVDLQKGDTHWRPAITRDWTDTIQVSAGANIMTGPNNTFFGQLSNNTNAYFRVRYSL